MKPTLWEAASGAASQIGTKYDWWVSRYLDGPGVTGDFATTKRGHIRTFKTFDAADRAAKQLNQKI